MKQLIALLSSLITSFAFAATPTGYWQTIDDETGKPASIVHIQDTEGALEGTIVKVFHKEGQSDTPVCKHCTGKLKDKPLIGMRVLWGLTPSKLSGGHLLAPKKGTVVNCDIKLVNDDTLSVHGYKNAFLGKTTTWTRVEKP